MDEDIPDVGKIDSGGYHGASALAILQDVSVGTKVYYIDDREGHGILAATVADTLPDGTVGLLVRDINAIGGCFNVMSSAHDESMKPGTWHYPK